MMAFTEVFRCARCGSIDAGAIGSLSTCAKCGVDLHACIQCQSFDPGARFECRETIAARVSLPRFLWRRRPPISPSAVLIPALTVFLIRHLSPSAAILPPDRVDSASSDWPLSTRSRNVPFLHAIEMSPSSSNGLWARWKTRPGVFHGVHRSLHRLAARLSARSRSSARVSRRHGWSALGRKGDRAFGTAGRGADTFGGGAAISLHVNRWPR